MPDPPGLPKLQEGLVAAREWLDKAQVCVVAAGGMPLTMGWQQRASRKKRQCLLQIRRRPTALLVLKPLTNPLFLPHLQPFMDDSHTSDYKALEACAAEAHRIPGGQK